MMDRLHLKMPPSSLKYGLLLLVLVVSMSITLLSERVLAQESSPTSESDEGLVLVTVAIRPLAVSYGMTEGKHVHVVLTVPLVDVDEEFQSILPNSMSTIGRDAGGGLDFGDPLQGRHEASPLSALGVLIMPSEPQRPRLVSQQVIQNVEIIHMDKQFEEINLSMASEPVPVRVTLEVSTQDALMLIWAMEVGLRVDLLLLPEQSDTTSAVETQPVNLKYLTDKYGFDAPPSLSFDVQPSESP